MSVYTIPGLAAACVMVFLVAIIAIQQVELNARDDDALAVALVHDREEWENAILIATYRAALDHKETVIRELKARLAAKTITHV